MISGMSVARNAAAVKRSAESEAHKILIKLGIKYLNISCIYPRNGRAREKNY